MKDPADRHHLIIDEKCAPIVRLIFYQKLSGASNATICAHLNLIGAETPRQRIERLNGRDSAALNSPDGSPPVWLPSSISRILANEIYTGTMVTAKRSRPNYKIRRQKANDKSLWCRVEGTHEAIIPKDIYSYIQDVTSRSQPSFLTGFVRPLTGFLRCPDCGMLMQHCGSPNSPNEYYNCSSYLRKECCFSHNLNLKRIEAAVLGAIRIELEYLIRVRDRLRLSGTASYREATLRELDKPEAPTDAGYAENY